MKDFFEKNKTPLSIIIAAIIIGVAIWLSKKFMPLRPQEQGDKTSSSQQLPKTTQPAPPALRIDYTEAPNHVGEYACVTGKVDHVSKPKQTTFLNFCSDYRNCPFGAVIFEQDAHKFPNPRQYQGRTVEITGLVRSYQGRAEIILKDPGQIKILPSDSLPVEPASSLYRVVTVIDGDTIKVDVAGMTETVRLIGIDTPEISNPHHPKSDYYGPEAAQYTKQLLQNQSVYLIPDPMESNRDKYGRLLRYVFLEDGTFVNAKLVEDGYAYNYIYEPFQFMKYFDYLEKQAKEKHLGLWQNKETE
jgi:micrococcal nuclease